MNHPRRKHKSNSPVIAVILLIALTAVISGSVFVFAQNDKISSLTAETHLNIHAEVKEVPGGNARDVSPLESQRIRVYHMAGDSVPVRQMEVVLRIPTKEAEARITNLPVEHLSMDENVDGDGFLDLGVGGIAGAIKEEGEWGPGDFFEFRVKKTGEGFVLGEGDVVEVVVLVAGVVVFEGEADVTT